VVVAGDALKGWVRADRADARRLLRALVENALQFGSSGGEVRISATATGGRVRFVVEDDGIGIHLDHHGRIFDKFWQVEDPLRRSHGGCGLGLSLARRIAEAHGSALDVKSSPGKGATFSFSLEEGCVSEALGEGVVSEGAGGVHVEEACSHRG
jgi:two-component system phosphate regulon sensor histidine kinase PhoR